MKFFETVGKRVNEHEKAMAFFERVGEWLYKGEAILAIAALSFVAIVAIGVSNVIGR
jgi:hypothetical protein